MYCPKCGKLIEQRNGTWQCTSGGLEFSAPLGIRLEQRFAAAYRPGRVPVGDMRLDLWYCPSCGVPTDSKARCPDCTQSLKELLYPLIEFHPHSDGKGGYR